MFRYLFTIAIFILTVLAAFAQMVNPEQNLFSDEPFFNPEFIKKNKIKSISTEHFFKPDQEKMHPKGLIIIYEFSPDGNINKRISKYRMPGGDFDTTYIYYEFDQAGRWSIKRTIDNFGFYSLTFIHDEKGNVIEEVLSRELNATASKGNFILSKQYHMGSEKYEIDYITSNFFKKRFLNNIGKPFKEIAYALNDKGKVIEETGTFLTTRMLERKTYKYDANNRLVEKTEYSDASKQAELLYEYKYDEKSNLVEIKKLRNSLPLLVTDFMLDERSFIIAKLSRDNAAKMIDVIKFSYEFHL
ncbi:MAG: hypothetical protein H0X62_03110 [Bacteroidetes bacterium]|nr:hypothetical protein [Bacteroidota bacterium]